jgi:alkylation response protein AidB-like acyl-CoA dehydrogenase
VDFAFSQEQEAFRQEVRAFLEAELPPDWVGYLAPTTGDHAVDGEEGWRVFRNMARKLGEKGWLSLFWPKEYGGQSRPYVDYLIFAEEVARRGSPGYNPVAVKMFAPALIEYGTEAQKTQHLKLMSSGQEFWCEAFSEPEAGSDLAGLKTKAVKDGDDFLINGEKTWGTFATHADWCCLLARSDPEAQGTRGLSFFMVDLSSPGIEVIPIKNMANEFHFAQIFFDEVRVSRENLVGEENQGWRVAQAMLGYERTSIEFVAMVQAVIEKLTAYTMTDPKLAAKAREPLAQLTIDAEIGRLLNYRVAWYYDQGRASAWQAAMAKLYCTDLFKRAAGVAMKVLGLYGQLDKEDKLAPERGWFEHAYLVSYAATIAAGTSEIQKNIIARKELDLPKG